MKTVWLVLLLTACAACALPEAETAIRAAYDRSCEAARLKFVDGMLSIRSSHFVCYSNGGKRIDLRHEWADYQEQFRSAVSIDDKIVIEQFEQPDAEHAVCLVLQRFEIVSGPRPRALSRLTISTRSRDLWSHGPNGWQEAASRIVEQTATTVHLP